MDLFDPGEINASLMTYSLFANDTWRVNNRFTLTPSIRFDRFANYLADQEHAAERFSTSPIAFAEVQQVSN